MSDILIRDVIDVSASPNAVRKVSEQSTNALKAILKVPNNFQQKSCLVCILSLSCYGLLVILSEFVCRFLA